ncbi:hypothetical protein FJT64_023397 [Amphibalanus amphitrite]|uniref:Farnesoic acid O-methyl transferase domain-containing protein n=1 Tax=Amphibalanus amphitrite TaxID=1232801 RepID=A0A6A4WC26_AMPAM|nr:hypothetical protein FJT64_023397 [Amphibalanus amphitrite]
MNITVYPWIDTNKKLKSGTCSLNMRLQLGVDANVTLNLVGLTGESNIFTITLSDADTTITYSDATAGQQTSSATHLVNSDSLSQLQVSWCGDVTTLGPAGNPSLVSVPAAGVSDIGYLSATSSGPESLLQVEKFAADEWLFDEQGTSADPIFSFGQTMISRQIEPTVDVTVKYDCMSKSYCSVYLRSEYPRLLTIFIGAWSNSASGLAYDKGSSVYFNQTNTGPVLSPTEFNTFTVSYRNGSVTIFRNDESEPIFNVTSELMPPITSVGIGSMHWGSWKSVRVARYDRAWATDSWITDDIGFSNMDTTIYSP